MDGIILCILKVFLYFKISSSIPESSFINVWVVSVRALVFVLFSLSLFRICDRDFDVR